MYKAKLNLKFTLAVIMLTYNKIRQTIRLECEQFTNFHTNDCFSHIQLFPFSPNFIFIYLHILSHDLHR